MNYNAAEIENILFLIKNEGKKIEKYDNLILLFNKYYKYFTELKNNLVPMWD